MRMHVCQWQSIECVVVILSGLALPSAAVQDLVFIFLDREMPYFFFTPLPGPFFNFFAKPIGMHVYPFSMEIE